MKRRRDSGKFSVKDLTPVCLSLPFCDGLPLVYSVFFKKQI